MTEKQINQLKSLLSESNLKSTSKEFDQSILQASRDHLEQQAESKPGSRVSLSTLLLPLSAIRSAIIAVCLTIAIFVGMGQMLTFKSADLMTSKAIGNDVQITPQDVDNTDADQRIDKPKRQIAAQAPSQIQRDKDLLNSIQDSGLPQTSELLANMEFSLDNDRSYAQASIDLAMSDIRSMIDIGELNNARERYVQLKRVQLKEHCPPCDLPESLDAFYISSNISLPKTG